jgi:hypothetical protein
VTWSQQRPAFLELPDEAIEQVSHRSRAHEIIVSDVPVRRSSMLPPFGPRRFEAFAVSRSRYLEQT